MNKQARLDEIVALLKGNASLRVNDLAESLNVSKETLRRDLKYLQLKGLLVREYGKAKSLKRPSDDPSVAFESRSKSHAQRKSLLADKAIEWITPGMCIALDASSTCWHLAKKLRDQPLTVYTNSYRICHELEKKAQIEILCSGGTLDRKYASYINDSPLHMVRNIDIDLFIFSCDGVDADGNIWDTDNGNTLFKKFMLKKSLQSILLVDSSKIERSGEVIIGQVSAVTTVIRQ